MKKEKSGLGMGILIGLIIGLLIGGLGGFLFLHTFSRSPLQARGNFQIDQNTKNQITSFFDSNPDASAITSYCQQNRINCMYYCRSINPSNEICKSLGNYSRGSYPMQGGN